MAEDNKPQIQSFKDENGNTIYIANTEQRESKVGRFFTNLFTGIGNGFKNLYRSGDSGSLLEIIRVSINFVVEFIKGVILAVQTFIDERSNNDKDKQ